MATLLPQSTDTLNNPDHAFLHRVFAADDSAPEQSISISATGLATLIAGLVLGGDLDINGKNIDFPTTPNISDCLDEDNMSSDSPTKLATQQSIKAYADTKIANVVEDTTPQLGGDLDINGKNIDFPTTPNISDCLDEDNMSSDSATKLATQQSIKAYTDLMSWIKPPQGFATNYKITPSVSSDNLTLALKGMDGNDPSASNPIRVRIGDTIRSITSALSVTINAGTNWFDSGGSELATNETDYFVYLGYNATDGVVLGFARFPSANLYSDFSVTTTNAKYAAISDISNAAASDDYVNIGRFAATLSAGAGYTWTVPSFTTSNLINKPFFETRLLTFTPTLSWTGGGDPSGSPTIQYRYKIRDSLVYVKLSAHTYNAGTANTQLVVTLPFDSLSGAVTVVSAHMGVSNAYNDTLADINFSQANNLVIQATASNVTAWMAAGEYPI